MKKVCNGLWGHLTLGGAVDGGSVVVMMLLVGMIVEMMDMGHHSGL